MSNKQHGPAFLHYSVFHSLHGHAWWWQPLGQLRTHTHQKLRHPQASADFQNSVFLFLLVVFMLNVMDRSRRFTHRQAGKFWNHLASWRKTFNTVGLCTLKNKVWREGFVHNPILISPRQAVWWTHTLPYLQAHWLRASPHLTIEANTSRGQFVADLMAHSGLVTLGREWQNWPFSFPV